MAAGSTWPPAPTSGPWPGIETLMTTAVTAGPFVLPLARTLDRRTPLAAVPDPRGLRVAELDAARQVDVLQVLAVLVHTLGRTVGMAEIHRHGDATCLGRVAGTGGSALG